MLKAIFLKFGITWLAYFTTQHLIQILCKVFLHLILVDGLLIWHGSNYNVRKVTRLSNPSKQDVIPWWQAWTQDWSPSLSRRSQYASGLSSWSPPSPCTSRCRREAPRCPPRCTAETRGCLRGCTSLLIQ